MAAEDISGSLGLDTTDWKTGISQINRDVRVIESGFKAVAAGMDDWGKSAEGLNARQTALTDIMGKQKSKVALLEAEYKRMKDEAEANGDTTERTAAALGDFEIKLNGARAQVAKSETEYRKNAATLTDMQAKTGEAEKATGELATKQEAAEKATKSFGERMKEMGATIGQGVVVAAKAAAAAIAAVGVAIGAAVKQAFNFAAGAGKMADDVMTLSAQTGIATDKLQGWAYASNFVDVSVDTMTGSMAKMIKGMGSGNKAFDKLGVATKDANGNMRDSEDVFADSIDALGKMTNETERDALAMQIFGKSAQDLNPLILAGGDAFKALSEEARAMGVVFDDKAIKAMGSFDDSMQRAKAAGTGLKNAIGLTVIPIFQPLVDTATTAMAAVSTALADGIQPGEIETIMQTVLTTISDMVGQIMSVMVNAMPYVIEGISAIVTQVVAYLPTLVETMLPAAFSLLQSIVDAVVQNIDPLITLAVSLLTSLAAFLVENLPTLATAATSILTGLIDGIIAALPSLIPAAVEMMVSLAVALVAAIPSLVEKLPEITAAIIAGLKAIDWAQVGLDLLNGLVGGLSGAISSVIESVKGIFGQILTAIKGLFGIASPSTETAKFGGFLLDGLIGGIGAAIGGAVEIVKSLFGQIWDAIKSIFGFGGESQESKDAKKAGEDITKGIADGVTSVSGDAEKAVETTAGKILAKYRAVLGLETDVNSSTVTKPYGEATVKGILSGIETQGTEATFTTASNTLAENILRALNTAMNVQKSISQKFVAVGKAIADGVKKGIEDGAQAIVDAAVKAANAALKAAKDALGIKSPSKKAHDEIGINWGLGVAGGITDSVTAINAAMSKVTSGLSGAARGVGTAGVGAGAGGNIINNHEYITINSPEALTPGETVRLWRNGRRQLAMGMGGNA